MECSLVYRACSTKGIAQGEEIQDRDWEFKSPSNSPPKLEPTMTSLFLQSLQAPPGMSLSSQLPALPSYFLFYLLCLRQWGSPTFILRKTIYSHVSDFSLPTLLCILAPYNLFFIFPPEEAAFTPAQTFQVTRMRATGLYLCITSKAFIGRQSQNCQHTTLTCISLFIHHS